MRRDPEVRPPHLSPSATAPGPAPGREALTIALSGAEFGWGSSGKLSAVLSALRERSPVPLRFVGLGSGLGRPLLTEHPIEHWYDLPESGPTARAALEEVVRSQGVEAALVVLDGPVAGALEAAGVPTVFVDSLPFLWTEGDRPALPLDATVYCAQRSPELPPECQGILASIPRLRWVEAIVGTPPVPRAGGSAGRPCRKVVVSLGGLRAPRLADWTSYPRLVVPAVLEALAAHGVRDVRLTGNLSAGLLADFVGRSPLPLRVTAGALPHAAFLAELAGCDALLTSPGLTTLLEAGSLGVPTLCLPPQNLSQIFNARFQRQAVGADVQVTWPEDVLREDDILAVRAKGEDHALEMIYEAIGRAAARADAERVVAALSDRILAALRHTAEPADWGALATAVGTGGAAQVADAVLAAAGQSPPSS
ncbi:hydroxymethylcytosylglucuronate/cytosylglucuronate synthase [Streptomyces triculaminicus]|uniref:hydroxymethylcytosylglucuronate/cytosylglucurona te synthase n=1 Tax=Streptomyces triculaminicus TaxID=2816232 RepID=UPI0033DEB0BA